jgi:hypothetical protein
MAPARFGVSVAQVSLSSTRKSRPGSATGPCPGSISPIG